MQKHEAKARPQKYAIQIADVSCMCWRCASEILNTRHTSSFPEMSQGAEQYLPPPPMKITRGKLRLHPPLPSYGSAEKLAKPCLA